MAQLSGYDLYVLVDHAPYSNFSIDLSHVYTDKAEAQAECDRINAANLARWKGASQYWVESLDAAISDVRRDGVLQGEENERYRGSW